LDQGYIENEVAEGIERVDRTMMFIDRRDAGRRLAAAVKERLGEAKGVIVLGLPRGGVVVAQEVARVLRSPLDVLVVRKIGAPGTEELAIGAVGETGAPVLNDALIESAGVPSRYLAHAIDAARREVRRRVEAYRAGPHPDVHDKTVVLVDDGIATGYTVEAAITTLRGWQAARIILAVPVAPPQEVARFRGLVDDTVILYAPPEFFAVGQFYGNFAQVSDDEVKAALSEMSARAA
jgi:predicted phosphoribosyltransferase